jgi:hypothetical protein
MFATLLLVPADAFELANLPQLKLVLLVLLVIIVGDASLVVLFRVRIFILFLRVLILRLFQQEFSCVAVALSLALLLPQTLFLSSIFIAVSFGYEDWFHQHLFGGYFFVTCLLLLIIRIVLVLGCRLLSFGARFSLHRGCRNRGLFNFNKHLWRWEVVRLHL